MAVVRYSYKNDGNKSLSPHFKVREFASINSAGKIFTDVVLVDSKLIEMLERLYTILGCADNGSITITSGYRSPAHDVSVGGNGKGQHTIGTAADIICRAKGKVINAKIICCICADLGFGGVANINRNYSAVHVDVRSSNKYYGDEIYNYNSIWYRNSTWTDFYKYFNLSKAEVDKYRVGTAVTNQTPAPTTPSTSNPSIKTTGQSGSKPIFKWLNIKDNQILELQRILINKGKKITADGFAGPKTYDAVKNYTIELNDRGELTKWVQKRLTSLGFPCTADGIAGAKTMEAIKKFQTANKLGTGYLGGTDWYYLVSPVIS